MLARADVELGICASGAGIEVLATELYGNARLSRDETLERLLERRKIESAHKRQDLGEVEDRRLRIEVREEPLRQLRVGERSAIGRRARDGGRGGPTLEQCTMRSTSAFPAASITLTVPLMLDLYIAAGSRTQMR